MRGQNSPRGLFIKDRIVLPSTKGVMFQSYSESNDLLTGNSTGLVVKGGVKVSNAITLTGNSTGILMTAKTAIPSAYSEARIALVVNSTGKACLAVRSTGATWLYTDLTATSQIT